MSAYVEEPLPVKPLGDSSSVYLDMEAGTSNRPVPATIACSVEGHV